MSPKRSIPNIFRSRFLASLCLVLATATFTVDAQQACTTPKNAPGVCIVIQQCQVLYSLFQDRYRSPEDTRLLRNSQCGQENNSPKVCCEKANAQPAAAGCITPDNDSGQCISIYQCDPLRRLTQLPKPIPQNVIAYLRSSSCPGADRYYVCCSGKQPSVGGGATPNPQPSGGGGGTITNPRPTTAVDVSHLLPDPKKCGSEAGSDRIIGGEEAAIDQFPWMGLIEYVNRFSQVKLGCSGSLISVRYVVTAAHCVAGQVLTALGTPTNVRFGDHDKFNAGSDCQRVPGGGEDCNDPPVTIPIESYTPHPQYENVAGPKNDIAMIRLQSNAPYTDFIRPICLPTTDVTSRLSTRGVNFTVAGWGTTESGEGSAKKLYVMIPFVQIQECQAAYTAAGVRASLWDNQICAGGDKGKDSCRGDSGGPLMVDVNARFNLAGVVSFGPTPCAKESVPGVYTKVYSYLDWIKSELKP